MDADKRKIYKFTYSGDQIRSITEAETNVKDEGMIRKYAHWIVVVSGVILSIGWYLLWV